MELIYDYGFNTGSQFNGNISGIKWRSMGDGDYRSYGFAYDASNRLLRADFNQRVGYNDWKKAVSSNLNINFSMYMGDGVNPGTGYDANGNILIMNQYGLQQNTSPLIDQLNYSYQQNSSSNKLDLVTDASGFTPKLGDFKDGINNGSDYGYDANGNMKVDANKSISNITYNYLNLPEQISVTGKGTITYTYDALGGKRSKTVTESGVSVTYKGQTYAGITITTANYYVNSWVYESKSYSDITLQNGLGYATKALFSGHEDGRIRPIYSNNTLTAFAGDYFIKDHLGNIRMVLTDEQQVNYYPATTLEGTYSYTAREVNSLVNHEKKFYRIDPVYIVNKPWLSTSLDYQNHNNVPLTNPNPNYPAGVSPLQSATSKKVYSLNAGTNRTGLEMVIKVMAGDNIDIFGRSYHSNGSAVSNSNSTPLSILQIMSGVISSPSNAISSKGVTASQLESWNSSLLPSTFIRGQNFETGTTIPKAYINYIFLDEQFRYVSGGASRVGNYGEVKQHWSELSNLAAQKNGYLLVYVSNESNFTVFFDNLQVVHKPGPILEEMHYYPFGLTMSGISSKGFSGVVENKKKYNGIEQNSDFDLNMYDAFYRNLDPQIGRFWQTDPSPSFNLGLYTAFDNNPILKNDILGDTAVTRWRSGFLGLGAKHEARYVGGTWIDSKTRNAIDPKSVRSGARSIMNDYGKLNSISSFSALTDKVNSTVNSVNLISGNGPASGGSEINTLKYFSDLKAGVTNPDIDVYVAKGQSISSSIIEGNKGGQLPSYIGMGHELGHAWDILNSGSSTANFRQIPGLSPGLSNSEVNAMFWENVLRADAGMPLRTMYNYDAVRGAELPANINISNAGRLPLIGRTLQSVTLGSLNMGVTYKFLRIK